jgi:hypothetical protein
MATPTILAGSVICSDCASSSTLFTTDTLSRRRARRAAMQLNLNLLDHLAPPPSPSPQVPTAWEQIDAAARIAAVEILARLITRMLQDEPAMEARDE